MTMWRRRFTTLAIQIVVFALLAEVAAVVVHYYDVGWLYYVRPPRRPVIEETARGVLSGDVLHPYFGPIHRVGVRAETNNVGFGSPLAFPYARTSEPQFLVGIFGGSVARQFCDAGVARLAADLRTRAALGDREIVPLCFAHEGYKQPQQLLVLSYFLSVGQALDLAVNIDGFNEVALGTYNDERGRDITMPSPLHVDPIVNLIDRTTLTPDALYVLADISRAKERLNTLATRLQGARSAAVGVLTAMYYDYTRARYEADVARFAGLSTAPAAQSMLQLTPRLRPRDGEQLYADIAGHWANASQLMADALAARRVPYVHVLQPNQYHSQHAFSADEARIAINPATPFKPPVERGYPVLRETGRALAQRLPFFDATDLFDREPQAVYQDDCCHYNARGNELLGAFIAARAADVMRREATSR